MSWFRSLLRVTVPALLLICGWPITAHADPSFGIGTGILISMAISAATAGASMLLTRILTPKPKGQVKGKMQGEIRLSDSTWDVAKNEIFGFRFADGIGGVEVGVNFIWLNKEGIREHRTVVQASSSGGGGGKGPPKPPPETRITYDCDCAFLVGKGPLRILRMKFNEDIVYNVPPSGAPGTGQITGIHDPTYPPEVPYDHYLPPNPYTADTSPRLRHDDAIVVDPVDNSVGVTIVGGAYADIQIYEGNEDQEPDPVIQTDVDSIYGANSTPAYLNDCYVRLSGLNITKYNGFPNIVVLAENVELQTIEEIVVHRTVRSGLLTSDLDMSALSTTPCRGYAITTQQAAKKDLEDFAIMFNFDFVETPDGTLQAVDLSSRTLTATLTDADLGAYVKDGQSKAPIDAVVTKIPDESEMWKTVRVQFFNPLMEFQVDAKQQTYPFTTSQRNESIELMATLLPQEADLIALRILQMHWAGAFPHEFSISDQWIWLYPTNRILMPISGEVRAVRLSEVQGISPGVLRCSAYPDELVVFAAANLNPVPPSNNVAVPANTVATFLDIPWLHPQAVPGIYIAATPKDIDSGYWPGATAYRFKDADEQQMTTFVAPATMGRTTNALADVPASWSGNRNNFVKRFYAGAAAGGGGGTGALNRMPDTVSELEPWAERLRGSDPLLVARNLGRALFLSQEYMNRLSLSSGGTSITRTNLVGVIESGGNAVKTASSGWSNGGFSSVETLVGDGYIEWVAIGSISDHLMVGLSTTDADADFATIGFAIYQGGSSLVIYEGGSSVGTFGTYTTSTMFRMERVGSTLSYYKDGGLLRSTTITTADLIVDCAINTSGGTVGPITLSTGSPVYVPRTNLEFVTDLYSAYLNRDPDDAPDVDMSGRDFWVGELDGGDTRDHVILAFEVSPEFEARVQAAAATFFDTTSTVTIDLFGQGEPTSLTDDQARAGLGVWVFGNEAVIPCVWTRDMSAANRWTGTRMIRRLKNTDAASGTHVAFERCVLMNSAVRFVELDESEQGITRIWRVITTGARLQDGADIEVTWNGKSIPPDPLLDPHVPGLGDVATITKDEASPSWIIYTPKPAIYGATITDLELWQYSDSGGTTLIRSHIGNLSGRSVLAQTVADAYFRYRWRNKSLEDIGSGRGWSELSGVSSVAAGTGSGTPPPDDGPTVPPPIDPTDGGAGGGPGGCFVAGTMLRRPDGIQAIETFEADSPIMVWDFALGQLVASEVERVEVHERKLTRELVTGDGRTARLSDEQPIHTGAGNFTRSDRLLVARSIEAVNDSGELVTDRVDSLDTAAYATVHHLHVKHPDHNYVLENGIIAHNIKRPVMLPP